MIIDYLGHSEFLVNIQNSKNENIKILSDAWLSNYVFGDLMARNPTFKLDYEKLGNIDAIFISHSHSDHFDPYTLVEMYKNFKNLPILLIPETIKFLVPLIEKYLPNFSYKILKNKEEIIIRGIKIKGLIFENDYSTNEDDVMTLFVYTEKEIFYAEVDTLPPEVDEAHNYIYEMLSKSKYETVLYIATRNELEGNIKLLDIDEINKRKKFASEYIKTRKEEIEWNLAKYDEGIVEYMDFSKTKNFCKAFIGQGIGYPNKLDINASKVHILSLDEIVSIEKSNMQKYGKNYPITHFEAGQSYEIINGKFNKIGKINYLNNFIFSKEQTNLETKFRRFYSNGPINNEKRDTKNQENLIIDLINNRFLPYKIADLDDSMKNILISKKSDYVIKVIYGYDGKYEEKYYSFGFGSFKFQEVEKSNYFDEDYYANDLEDFYNGIQELYSNFWHKLNPKCSYRLWTVLGANFINNDLIYKKYEVHFKKASLGFTVDEFVENIYKNLI